MYASRVDIKQVLIYISMQQFRSETPPKVYALMVWFPGYGCVGRQSISWEGGLNHTGMPLDHRLSLFLFI